MIIIRCDDVFVDTDVTAVEKIWSLTHRVGISHMIAITPQGMGNPIHHQKPLKRGNEWIFKATGVKRISKNKPLIDVISKYKDMGSKIAIHGLDHINYRKLYPHSQYRHIVTAKGILEPLFGKIEYFVPPFNKSNEGTIKACEKLDLKIVPSYYEADTKVINNNVSPATIEHIAKEVISVGNCAYHPYWLQGGWSDMKHNINGKIFNISRAKWTLDDAIPHWERFLKLIKEGE